MNRLVSPYTKPQTKLPFKDRRLAESTSTNYMSLYVSCLFNVNLCFTVIQSLILVKEIKFKILLFWAVQFGLYSHYNIYIQLCRLQQDTAQNGEERAGCFTLFSRCLVIVIVLWQFLAVPWVGMHCVVVMFPD